MKLRDLVDKKNKKQIKTDLKARKKKNNPADETKLKQVNDGEGNIADGVGSVNL